MFKFILQVFLIFLVVRIIFRYVFPLFQMVTHTSKKMKEFEKRVNAKHDPSFRSSSTKRTSAKSGDYIDYEEVKS